MYRLLPRPKSYFGERSTRCVSMPMGKLAVPFSGDELDDASASADEAA